MGRAGRILAALLVLVLVAGVAICAAMLAISRGWQRERLRAEVETLLADAFSDEVAIARIGGPLLPRLDVHGLRVGPEPAPTLEVDRITLRIAWRRSLSERRLVLRAAEVEGAHLEVSRDARGAWNLPPWLASDAETPPRDADPAAAPLAIRVERTRLRDLTARLAWEQDGSEAALLLSADAALEAWSLPFQAGTLRGRLQVDVQGRGAATRWLDSASVEASLDGARIGLESLELAGGGRPPLRLAAPAALVVGGGRVRFEQLELHSEAQALLAGGAVSAERFHDLQLELREVDLALAAPLVDPALAPAGHVTGRVALDGPLLRPDGAVDLVWREPRIGDWRGERVHLEASGDGRSIHLRTLSVEGAPGGPLRLSRPARLRVADDGVELEDFALRSADQTLVANGGVSAQGFRKLELELRAIDVALLARLAGLDRALGGSIGGEATLDGSFTRPTGRVDLVWGEPSVDGWRADAVALRASGDGREVRIAHLVVEGAPGGRLRLERPARLRIEQGAIELGDLALRSGDQTLVANGGVSAQGFRGFVLELRAIDVALVAHLAGLGAEVGGSIGGEARLDGRFTRPTGRIDLHWRDPRLRDWRGESLSLQADADGERARLEAEVVRGGRETLAVGLELTADVLERSLRGEPPSLAGTRLPEGVRARLRADAARIASFAPLLPEPLRDVQGELSGTVALEGGPQPQWSGDLVLSGASLPLRGREPIAPLHIELGLRPDPGALHVERLRIRAPTWTLEASGAPGLDGPADLEARLAVEDLEAAALALELPVPLAGALSAGTSLRGDWPRPALEADLAWTHPASGPTQPYRVDVALATRERELAGTLSVRQHSRVAARGALRVPYGDDGLAGVVEGARHGVLELQAEDFDLATVAPLLPRLVRDLRGRADADLTLRAHPERPSLAGDLRVEGGSVTVPVLRRTFEPIALDARFREDTLHIEALRVGEPGAHAEASGHLRLGDGDAPGAVELDVALVDLPFARARPLSTDVSGELHLEGPFDALHLDGAIALSDTQVRLVDAGDPALREIEVIASDAQREGREQMRERVREADAYEQASIDVAITVPRNSWVRGRGADIDLAGALRLEKAPGGVLRLSGEVAAVRGNYRFQGKRFDIRRGSVAFSGTADPDPVLDIEADHRVRDVTIVIHLTGRASEPVVSLASEPPLPEDDVLSYLFFGRPTSELGAQQPARDLDQAATALAAGIALREAARLVEDVAPIDTIDVRIEEDGAAGNVGVGKYLTNDLFIRYERGFGEEAVDGVKIELRLDERWSVEGEATTDESAGADLVWSFDY